MQILKIENDGMHLLVKAKINNKVARLIVDTGASRTVFDKNRIQRFVNQKNFEKHKAVSTGLGTNNMESHIAKVKKFEIGTASGGIILNKIIFVLLDLYHVNNSYSQIGMKKIDGVLGGDILMKYKATIDYGKKKMTLIF